MMCSFFTLKYLRFNTGLADWVFWDVGRSCVGQFLGYVGGRATDRELGGDLMAG